ncbi:MarR family winged helix-turn-helix transcriptional regulator [Priestia megaterium]|uniref:MarR family winged helix-turn-helix transcriptional regulator n=1 Tax=Priestia megaterium TaxID=1404 RepID=UPI00399D11EA
MKTPLKDELLNNWLSLTNLQMSLTNELQSALQKNHNLSLKEFYVLYFISQTSEKKLRLQQIQELVGLSQSATSRLVDRLEAENCGALQRHICEDDRRGIYTRLTPLGEEKLKKTLDTFQNVLRSSFLKESFQHELQSLMKNL